ncbi:MAG: MiaB/RimO family radical SAM methylthiotransferase [Coriobacteriales bacterium]|jgi:ribosomal protein S12 methylthiotransferase|nr:MiaB/RimO family radical SAM methylthiotransferase [Coriobacteriales bacterium]
MASSQTAPKTPPKTSRKTPQTVVEAAPKTVAFVTLGCAKNEVDSDKMRARLSAAGFALLPGAGAAGAAGAAAGTAAVDAAGPADADVVIVNTCSFITEATEEAISTIFSLLSLPRLAQGRAHLIVAGCMPARYGSALAQELPEVAAFVTCEDEDKIVDIVNAVLGHNKSEQDASHNPKTSSTNGDKNATQSPTELALSVSRTVSAPWAYVKIADGCNRFCSFCTIPHIRGRYRSVPVGAIVAEIEGLVAGGVQEIVLIAQDTGIWGGDIAAAPDLVPITPFVDADEPTTLAGLLELLATRFPDTWLRVMYLQPQGLTDELLAVMARHSNICNYLDIPLQHASARVLAEMNRKGSGAEYLALLARIRAALPDVALRTTVIAGFPGETRAEARELERFIEEAAFDYVGVFMYSQEEGTVAGRRTDQVPMRTRRARAQRLRDLADAAGFAKVAERVGESIEVLVTEYDEDAGDAGLPSAAAAGAVGAAAGAVESADSAGAVGAEGAAEGAADGAAVATSYPLLGRTKWQAPEVDGTIHLNRGRIGEKLSATIVETYCYELDGIVTEP